MNQNIKKHLNLIITILSISLIAGVALALRIENAEYIDLMPAGDPPFPLTCPADTGAIYYDSDDNTILLCNGTAWSPLGGADTLQTVTDNGNVTTNYIGIGATPVSSLHIKDTQAWGADLSLDATGLTPAGRRWLLISTGGTATEGAGKFLIKDNNAAAIRMAIDTTGNVSIPTGGSLAVTDLGNCGAVETTGGLLGCGTDANTWQQNTQTQEGYVLAGGTNNNKVWKTDGSGVPGWMDDALGSGYWTQSGTNLYPNNTGWNVGVGTDSPGYNLDVRGSRIQLLEEGTPDHWIALRTDGSALDLSFSGASLYVTPQNDNESIFLDPFNKGNVGIGTDSPTETLEVNGNIEIAGGEGADDTRINFAASDKSNRFQIETDLDVITTNDLLIFRASENDNMLVLKGNGNVGIGTTEPSAKLEVAGWYGRTTHNNGGLVGSYNNVGANSYKSNPIYVIGSNYKPADASLGNMYGIGYTHTNASFITDPGPNSWGMYVAADGDARIFLAASSGGTSYFNAGNVGIGTTGPAKALSITRNDGLVTENIVIYNPNTAWATEALIKAYSDTDSSGRVATAFGHYRGTSADSQSGFIVKTGTRDSLTTKFIINNGGNVGIGTTEPEAKLHVSAGDSSYAIYGPNATYGAKLRVGHWTGSLPADTAQVGVSNGNVHIDSRPGTSYATYLNYYSAGNVYMALGGGNVGIGTTNPSGHMLDVASTRGGAGNSAIRALYPGGGGLTGTEFGALAHRNSQWNAVYAKAGSAGAALYTDGEVNMMNGNVGIGTTNPGAKLEVNGNLTYSGNLKTNLRQSHMVSRTLTIGANSVGEEFYLLDEGIYIVGCNALLQGGDVTQNARITCGTISAEFSSVMSMKNWGEGRYVGLVAFVVIEPGDTVYVGMSVENMDSQGQSYLINLYIQQI